MLILELFIDLSVSFDSLFASLSAPSYSGWTLRSSDLSGLKDERIAVVDREELDRVLHNESPAVVHRHRPESVDGRDLVQCRVMHESIVAAQRFD
jgi:hypothetical protein